MKLRILVLLCSVLLVAAIGCAKKDDGNKGPKNPENPIEKLPPHYRTAFNAWKVKPVKACSASEAIGVSETGGVVETGVDGVALLQLNGNSAIFTEKGRFVILASHRSLGAEGNSKFEENVQVNGQTQNVLVETKYSGSNCQVFVYGQKVHETYIAESFTIGSEWAPDKAGKVTSQLPPQIRKLGRLDKSEVVQHGVLDAISEAFKPTEEAVKMLGAHFGLKEEQAKKLFRYDDYASVDFAVRIKNEITAVWSSDDEHNLIAGTGVLRNAFDGATRRLSVEMRLEIPGFSFGEVKNTADNGSLKGFADIQISRENGAYVYSAQAFQKDKFIPYNPDEAIACARERRDAYLEVKANQILPSVNTMFGPCQAFHRDIEKAGYEKGLMRESIPYVFEGMFPHEQFQYGGWDEVLSKLALDSLDAGQDIRKALDPESKTRMVGMVADNLEQLKSEIARTRNLGKDPARKSALSMGLSWAFRRLSVSAGRVTQILEILDNAVDTFPVSTRTLMEDLGRSPNPSSATDDQLGFAAQNIDADYKAEALKALGISKELDYGDFERDVFNQVIQKKVSLWTLQLWSKNLGGVKGGIDKYPNIGNFKGKLVGPSVKWLEKNEATLEDLNAVYAAIDNVAGTFPESTRELLNSLASQTFQNSREALEFARSISQEYKRMALTIREQAKATDFEDWGEDFFKSILQKRPTPAQLKTWAELWGAAYAFTQRENERTRGETAPTNEWRRKDVIEVAIEESWSNAEFTGLEAIAEMAKYVFMCNREKGASSLAYCGGTGLDLFSKKEGKFFYPAYSGRYVALSGAFVGYLRQLSGSGWSTLRDILTDGFLRDSDAVWSKCDQGKFNEKATTLKSQISAIQQETDISKRFRLQEEIRRTVTEDCR